MTNKTHAHLWYPKDMVTDKRVIAMTLEEEACYRRLMDYAWIENGLDNDLSLLASYCKLTGQPEKFSKIWKVVKKCFFLHRGKFKNKRQEKERKKQKLYSEIQRNRVKHRWDKELGRDTTVIPRYPLGNTTSQDQSRSDQISKRSDPKIDASPEAFTDDQKGKLMERIAETMGYSILSEANRIAFGELVEKVSKSKGVRNKFAYAMEAAKNLNHEFQPQKKG